MNAMPSGSLLAETLGRGLLISAAGIVAVGAAHLAIGAVAFRLRRQSSPLAPGRQRLLTTAGPLLLGRARQRAAAVLVVAIGLAIAAPWAHAFVDDIVSPWDSARGGAQPWRSLLLALVIWVGLLPLALFIWSLPWLRFGDVARAGAIRLAVAGRTVESMEPDQYDERRPHSEPVRRACREAAESAALWGSALDAEPDDPPGRRPSFGVVLLLPAAIALILAATSSVWLVVAGIAAAGAWAAAVYAGAYRAAVDAPGSAVADYLLLARCAAGRRDQRANRLAESCLDANPGIIQDHETLLGEFANAVKVSATPWSPDPASGANVDLVTRLWTTDRAGRSEELRVIFHLRWGKDAGWRIARLTLEDPTGRRSPANAHRFASAAAWQAR